MKTIEAVAFSKYLSDQKLPEYKRMAPENFIDWANFGKREAQRFISIEEELPPLGVEILLQNDKWIHEDFNPKGIRHGHYNGDYWVSAYWCNDQDCFFTRDSDTDNEEFKLSKAEDQVPTSWRPYERN